MIKTKSTPQSIRFVNHVQLANVIQTRKPEGKFLTVDPQGKCIAVDNRACQAWTNSYDEFLKAVIYTCAQHEINNRHLVPIMDLRIGSQYDDLKIAFSTYTVYRADENLYEIDRTTDGWVSATCTREKLFQILTGMASFDDLEFT